MKKINYLLPLVIFLTACSSSVKQQAPIEITNEYLASNTHKRQYTTLKNNDLNLWWQRWKDPAVLELLKESQSIHDTNDKVNNTFKTLQRRYNFVLNNPQWLADAGVNYKDYKLIQQDKFWYDSRTLLATITAKIYVDNIFCQLDHDNQKFYIKALNDVKKSNIDNLKTNIDSDIKQAKNHLETVEEKCKDLQKALTSVTGLFPRLLENIMDKSTAKVSLYQNSPLFDFPSVISAKTLMGRADVALAIQKFDIEWAKVHGSLEPISLEGIISPFSSGQVLSDNVFAIGGIAVHFPPSLRAVEVDNSHILELRKDILNKIQSAAIEISEQLEKGVKTRDIALNTKYKEQRTLEYLESIKGKGLEDEEFLKERLTMSKDLQNFLNAQQNRMNTWFELYLLTGIGFTTQTEQDFEY